MPRFNREDSSVDRFEEYTEVFEYNSSEAIVEAACYDKEGDITASFDFQHRGNISLSGTVYNNFKFGSPVLEGEVADVEYSDLEMYLVSGDRLDVVFPFSSEREEVLEFTEDVVQTIDALVERG